MRLTTPVSRSDTDGGHQSKTTCPNKMDMEYSLSYDGNCRHMEEVTTHRPERRPLTFQQNQCATSPKPIG